MWVYTTRGAKSRIEKETLRHRKQDMEREEAWFPDSNFIHVCVLLMDFTEARKGIHQSSSSPANGADAHLHPTVEATEARCRISGPYGLHMFQI